MPLCLSGYKVDFASWKVKTSSVVRPAADGPSVGPRSYVSTPAPGHTPGTRSRSPAKTRPDTLARSARSEDHIGEETTTALASVRLSQGLKAILRSCPLHLQVENLTVSQIKSPISLALPQLCPTFSGIYVNIVVT